MNKADFAFIVHSRDRSDLPRKFPILKIFPKSIFDFLTRTLPPLIVSQITGLTTLSGKESQGLIVGIPMTAHQLVEDRKRATRKIIKAVRLAKSKGAKYIGLGAMTSSLSGGGNWVIQHVPDVVITTGRTYTIKSVTDYLFYCVSTFHLKKERVVIGVVGAAGGIGSGVTLMLINAGFKRFVLIDLERKLERIEQKIKHEYNDVEITISHQVSAVKNCDIIIAATSSPEVVIKSEDVAPGSIIINDAQPSDISPEIINNRADVLVIEGGVVKAPGIDCHFNLGLHDKNEIYSCLAETLLLAYEQSDSHYSLNELDLNFFYRLVQDSRKLGLSIGKLQNSKGYISNDFIEKFTYNLMLKHADK